MTSLSPRRCNSVGPGTKLVALINEAQDNPSSLVFSEASSNYDSQSQLQSQWSSEGTEIIDQSVGIKYKSVASRWPKLSGRMAKSSHARFEKMNYITARYEEILSSSQSSMITLTRSNLAIQHNNNNNNISKGDKIMSDYISTTSTSSASPSSTINCLWESNRTGKWKSKLNYVPIGSDVRILSKIENELGPLRGKFSELAGKVKALNLIDVNSVFVNGHFDNYSTIKIINSNNNNYNYNSNCITDLNKIEWQVNNYDVTSLNWSQQAKLRRKEMADGYRFSSEFHRGSNLTREVNKPKEKGVVSEKYINKLYGINKRPHPIEDVVKRETVEHKICERDSICDSGDIREEEKNNDNMVPADISAKTKESDFCKIGNGFQINYSNYKDSGEFTRREQCGFRNKDSPTIYFNDQRTTDPPGAIPLGNKPDIYVGERNTKALRGMTCSPEDFY